jgi:hypothetical protein
VAEREGDFRSGQKGAIVELFGWPYADIEAECEDIAKMGYLGVSGVGCREVDDDMAGMIGSCGLCGSAVVSERHVSVKQGL